MRHILALFATLALLSGCASSVPVREVRSLSAVELNSIGILQNAVVSADPTAKAEDLRARWQCDGPVELEYAVYPLEIINGDKTAKFNSIWSITSPDKLYNTETPRELQFTAKQIDQKTMLHSIKVIVQPGPEGHFDIKALVYDRNEIGDSTSSELKQFAQKAQIAAANIYPTPESGIPVLSDIVDLGIGFVNLFRSNYTMCQLDETVNRTEKNVVFWAGKYQKAYCAFDVIPKSLSSLGGKSKCGPVKSPK